MDEQQQVFWTDINLCHKNKCPKKKKNNQHKRNYLLTSKQQNTVSKVPIQHGEHKKNGKKNLKLVFHLSVSSTTIHVVKLIPCLSSKKKNDDK